MEEVRRSKRGIEYIATVLKEKKTVVTRAIFWRIPHSTRSHAIGLKLGRYKRSDGGESVDVGDPKSELTLDEDECAQLVEFLQRHHAPLQEGATKYLVLDEGVPEVEIETVRRLFSSPDRESLVELLLKHEVLPDDLLHALDRRRKANAVFELEQMLAEDRVEADWQRFFETHDWILGSDFVRILDERSIDTDHIADYLMQAYDGFLDLVEIKRPGGDMKFWAASPHRGHPTPHSDLTSAITQAQRYVYEVEREANSVKTLERLDGVKAVKPRCTLIFGRSNNWSAEQVEAYRILNAGLHSISVLTYDHVLERARRLLDLQASTAVDGDGDIPF